MREVPECPASPTPRVAVRQAVQATRRDGNEAVSAAELERTLFDRLEALGLEWLGPRHPHGRSADPPPEPPHDPRNVPTYQSSHGEPATAEHQLDYLFGSRGFHESIRVHALNSVEE